MEKDDVYYLCFDDFVKHFRETDSALSEGDYIFTHSDRIIPSPIGGGHLIFDHLIIGICLEGEKSMLINFKEYKIKSPAIVFLLPNHIFKTTYESDDFRSEMIFLSREFLRGMPSINHLDMVMNMEQRPCIELTDQSLDILLEFHTLLIKHHYINEGGYRTLMVRSIAFCLFLEFGNIYLNQSPANDISTKTREMEIAEQFFKILTECNPTERRVSYYAERMCLTSKYLSSVIKKATALPIQKWINRLVIQDAMYLLKTTNLTIFQISEQLKFQSSSFFVQFFKQNTGITPLKYREDESNYTITDVHSEEGPYYKNKIIR